MSDVSTDVDLELFLKFNKMRSLVTDIETLARSLKKSELLEVRYFLLSKTLQIKILLTKLQTEEFCKLILGLTVLKILEIMSSAAERWE